MEPKEKALQAVTLLEEAYPEAICSLVYTDPLQLLIATRLAAQCTDKRVNMVTPALFERFPTVEAFADADIAEVESLIKTCGLYKTKAKDIVNMCRKLCEDYNGIVPDTIEALTTLPGVGRKTANLIVGDIFQQPAVVVDTHCIRITGRLGFHQSSCRLTVPTISVTVWYCTDVRSARPVILNAMPAVCKVFVSMPQTIHKIHSMMPQ